MRSPPRSAPRRAQDWIRVPHWAVGRAAEDRERGQAEALVERIVAPWLPEPEREVFRQ